jgi:hypothetical protein
VSYRVASRIITTFAIGTALYFAIVSMLLPWLWTPTKTMLGDALERVFFFATGVLCAKWFSR